MLKNFFSALADKARSFVKKLNATKLDKSDVDLLNFHRERVDRKYKQDLTVRKQSYFYYNPFLSRKERNEIAGRLRTDKKMSSTTRSFLKEVLRKEPRNTPYQKRYDSNGVQIASIPGVHAGLATPPRLILVGGN